MSHRPQGHSEPQTFLCLFAIFANFLQNCCAPDLDTTQANLRKYCFCRSWLCRGGCVTQIMILLFSPLCIMFVVLWVMGSSSEEQCWMRWAEVGHHGMLREHIMRSIFVINTWPSPTLHTCSPPAHQGARFCIESSIGCPHSWHLIIPSSLHQGRVITE